MKEPRLFLLPPFYLYSRSGCVIFITYHLWFKPKQPSAKRRDTTLCKDLSAREQQRDHLESFVVPCRVKQCCRYTRIMKAPSGEQPAAMLLNMYSWLLSLIMTSWSSSGLRRLSRARLCVHLPTILIKKPGGMMRLGSALWYLKLH